MHYFNINNDNIANNNTNDSNSNDTIATNVDTSANRSNANGCMYFC